jgi:hypothetical protein
MFSNRGVAPRLNLVQLKGGAEGDQLRQETGVRGLILFSQLSLCQNLLQSRVVVTSLQNESTRGRGIHTLDLHGCGLK